MKTIAFLFALKSDSRIIPAPGHWQLQLVKIIMAILFALPQGRVAEL